VFTAVATPPATFGSLPDMRVDILGFMLAWERLLRGFLALLAAP